MPLTAEEIERYNRHLILRGFGPAAQQKLRDARVLVVGAGGLGCPALLYLAAAGTGMIGITDFDAVHVTNLQRQVLFTESDVGHNKALAATERLRERNRFVDVLPFPVRVTSANALEMLRPFDVVVDATDNFASRYLLNDACVLLGKPLVYASILQYEGHVAVFNYATATGRSANYRDLFPEPPDADSVPDCSQAGVLGVLPGLAGVYQANEVIKILTGTGEVLSDRLLIIDALTLEQHVIRIRNRNSAALIDGLIDYEAFCSRQGPSTQAINPNNNTLMKEVTVEELKRMMDAKEDFQLIDVREPHEYDICNLGGELIPQGEIPASVERVSRDRKVVVHCRSGARSGNMVQWLEKNHGFTNLYNLKGGILAWAREIDPSMPQY